MFGPTVGGRTSYMYYRTCGKYKRVITLRLRGRPAGRFSGEITTPGSPGESLLQFLVGICSRNFTLRVSIVRILKYEHPHIQDLRVTIIVLMFDFSGPATVGNIPGGDDDQLSSVFPGIFPTVAGSEKSNIKTIIVTRRFCMCGCSYSNSRTMLTRKVKF